MLIEFRVKNFRSFKDEQIFTMESEGERGYFKETNIKKYPYVTTISGFYGANGSGKSNILRAITAMAHMINRGYQIDLFDQIKTDIFCLSSETQEQPTEFSIKFRHNKILYYYGFAYNSERIINEKLEQYNHNQEEFDLIFERIFNIDNNDYNISLGEGVSEEWNPKKARQNVLVLSKSAGDNFDEALKIVEWFQRHLHISDDNQFNKTYTIKKSETHKEQVLSLLRHADIGIKDFEIKEKEGIQFKFPEDMPERLQNFIREDKSKDVIFEHNSDGTGFSKRLLEKQSQGTKILFGLSGIILEALEDGDTLFIDEIDANMHPHLLAEIIELFKSPRTNPKGAQLIFAAHNTYLMDFLEREQIWFAEKDKTGATTLTSLWEYNIEDIEDFNKNYLLGRYNAVPHIATLMPYKLKKEGLENGER